VNRGGGGGLWRGNNGGIARGGGVGGYLFDRGRRRAAAAIGEMARHGGQTSGSSIRDGGKSILFIISNA